MGKEKLRKFAELHIMPNVFQNFSWENPEVYDFQREKIEVKGNWRASVFKNNNPIVLELACGKGEYSLGLARLYPNKNFIGIDLKGNRIWKGAKTALENKYDNVRFLRTKIELLTFYFEQDEIEEIWIIFPDPHFKKKSEKNRLTAPKFIDIYSKILGKQKCINLKTDSSTLYNYTLKVIKELNLDIVEHNQNIYSRSLINQELKIKTHYEKLHLKKGKEIKYIKFKI